MPVRIDVGGLLDNQRASLRLLSVILLVALCLVMDGFDLQAMGYAAPALLREWAISKAEMGPVFGAGVFGMLVGSLALSPLGDRLGRRPVIVAATLSFGLCMIGTGFAHTTTELAAWRFASGLGPGCILPNAMAVAGEYSPRRTRVTSMRIVGCGFGLGGAAAGALSAWLIPHAGWRSLFFVGGFASMALGVVIWAALPESIQLLVAKGQSARAIQSLVRLYPRIEIANDAELMRAESVAQKLGIRDLFRDGRWHSTALLWVINFANLLDMYFLANWLPTLVRESGRDPSAAALAGTFLWGAGVLGNLTLGSAIDRIGFKRVLGPLFLVAVVSIASIGSSAVTTSGVTCFTAIFFAGFSIIGGQPALNALAATSYPTSLRSTGVGWSLGIVRTGSVLGPLLCGWLIQLGWTSESLFYAAAIPAFISFSGVMAIRLIPGEVQRMRQLQAMSD